MSMPSLRPCAEGALECGGLTPPFGRLYVHGGPWRCQGGVQPPPFGRLYVHGGPWRCQGGVKPPHSKALRAFSWFLGPREP